jgi:hypothetical protein
MRKGPGVNPALFGGFSLAHVVDRDIDCRGNTAGSKLPSTTSEPSRILAYSASYSATVNVLNFQEASAVGIPTDLVEAPRTTC